MTDFTAPARFTSLWRRLPARWRTTLARTWWTAVQTFLGILLAVPLLEVDITVVQAAGASALSSALVVVKDAARGELRRIDELDPALVDKVLAGADTTSHTGIAAGWVESGDPTRDLGAVEDTDDRRGT